MQQGSSSQPMDRPLADVVVLDSPDGRRLKNMPSISETIGETSQLQSTLLTVADVYSNPMKDANMEPLHGDQVNLTSSYTGVR
jgi:hypothetical protein